MGPSASNWVRLKKISFASEHDMVMKMQAKRLAFVDVPYAKFYALSVSYCVWDPSAIAPLQDLIPSILPKLLRG
jgi:hypothetical protein